MDTQLTNLNQHSLRRRSAMIFQHESSEEFVPRRNELREAPHLGPSHIPRIPLARPCPDNGLNWDKEPIRNIWVTNDLNKYPTIVHWDQPLSLQQQPANAPPEYCVRPHARDISMARGHPWLLCTGPGGRILVPFPGRIRRNRDDLSTDSDAPATSLLKCIRIQPEVPDDI